MIDVNARIKKLQTEAVLAINHGTDEQSLVQINTNHEAIKQLIRDVVAEVTPGLEDTTAPGTAGSFNSGYNSAVRRVASNAKVLLD